MAEITGRRLSQNQQHLLDKVRSTSRQRADAVLKNANLSSEQMDAVEQAKQCIIKESRLVINRNLDQIIFGEPVIDSLLKSGRLYNLFEIEHIERDINPSQVRARLMSEFKIYGATPDAQLVLSRMSNTEHPNFAAMDYIGDPIAFSSPAHYGWYRFCLRDGVKRRCTFTPADSFVVMRNQAFMYNDIDAILASKAGFPPRFWFEYINEGIEPFSPDGSISYIEAQILGGVFLDEDVEELYYPETDRCSREFFPKRHRLRRRFRITLTAY
jgi:hypothetical protein